MKQKLLISACLCGENTKYNGGNNLIKDLDLIKNKYDIVLICPEVMGGLPTPRHPSEILGTKVVSDDGRDVSKEFTSGAQIALHIAQKNHIKLALLKESSPSCGKTLVHDGTFSGHKVPGQGITARLLAQEGIEIFTEKEIEKLL